ncbi:hypothetical protein C8J56DRAFT_1060222 [Mycena floridula]|nr:hypothetical protein C8J56DRAFT_1060222 [Mycena floridula]
MSTPTPRRSSRISQTQSQPATPPVAVKKIALPVRAGTKSKVPKVENTDTDKAKKTDSNGYPPSSINPNIGKRKAEDAQLTISTLRKDVRQLNRDVDRLQQESWDQAGIIQELQDTIIALNNLQNDQHDDALGRTAARLQALLNDTQTELQALRTDLRPDALCTSLDRLATAYTASQAGSDDEGDDQRSVELW